MKSINSYFLYRVRQRLDVLRLSTKIQSYTESENMYDLLSRQEYLVTQSNDLAKAFGNLTLLEHRLLDYCFSFVQKDDSQEARYETTVLDVIRHFGLATSGKTYKMIFKTFQSLMRKTALCLLVQEDDGTRSILMTGLFQSIKFNETSKIIFQFNTDVAPYIFQLKSKFYSFRLSELAIVKSKYTLTMLKLWNANAYGKWRNYNDPNSLPPSVTIKGTMEEWQRWFLGTDEAGNPRRWAASRFRQKVLTVALEEIQSIYKKALVSITTIKNGRKVVGYEVSINIVNTHLNL